MPLVPQPQVLLMRMRPSRFSINNLPRFRDVITGRDAHPCAIKITMKRKRLFLLASLLPMFALAGNKWNTTLPGGNMQFQGVIIAEACRIEAGDKQMTVNMGQISSNRFHAVGKIAHRCLLLFIYGNVARW